MMLTQEWRIPVNMDYEHVYARVARAVSFGGGLLVPNRIEMVLVSLVGALAWRSPISDGVWGSATVLSPDRAIFADLLGSLREIDSRGKITRVVKLPAPANTALLSGPEGEIYVGIGTLRCDALRVGASGSIDWQTPVARDDGLTYPLSMDPHGGIWIPTNRGLLLLDNNTGEVVTRVERIRCISQALPWGNGAVVAAFVTSDKCMLVHVTRRGEILFQKPLPDFERAQLLIGSDNEFWIIGSTAPLVDAIGSDSRVTIVSCSSLGQPRLCATLPGDRAVDCVFEPGRGLWVGTYTYDTEDRGTLYLLDTNGNELTRWSPASNAGVGVPVVLDDDRIYLPTSNGLVLLRASAA